MNKVIILGGGVSGLACDYYLNLVNDLDVTGYEKNSYLGGHAYSWSENGYVWDDGPHVFFGTKKDVEPFFNFSNDNEIDATVLNFADGHWINHPIYVNLIDLPVSELEILSKSLINSPAQLPSHKFEVSNYRNFLINTYGEYYAEKFPLRYNSKYWRSDLSNMSSDWINSRMFKPTIDQILTGTKKRQELHYINKFRYPVENGYLSYFKEAISNSRINTNVEVIEINLKDKKVTTNLGDIDYDFLINTMPLTKFVSLCRDIPGEVLEASNKLEHTSMLVVNLTFKGIVSPFFHWAYIHDINFFSTRITNYSNLNLNFNDHSYSNKETDNHETRLQIEVYESNSQPFTISHDKIARKVVDELIQMGVIQKNAIVKWSTRYAAMANVIFNLDRKPSLEIIYDYLESFGLGRNQNEFSANLIDSEINLPFESNLFLVGRFAQWNYYWTHDCAKKAKIIVNQIINHKTQISKYD
jgi:protoporphyrinogen oxidase